MMLLHSVTGNTVMITFTQNTFLSNSIVLLGTSVILLHATSTTMPFIHKHSETISIKEVKDSINFMYFPQLFGSIIDIEVSRLAIGSVLCQLPQCNYITLIFAT